MTDGMSVAIHPDMEIFLQQAGMVDAMLMGETLDRMVPLYANAATAASGGLVTQERERLAMLREKAQALMKIAEQHSLGCKQKSGRLAEEAVRAMTERCDTLAAMDKTQENLVSIQLEIDRLEAEMHGFAHSSYLLHMQFDELDRRIKDRESKNAKLRRWCWVPFYGFALAMDNLANDRGSLGEIRRRIDDHSRARMEFGKRLDSFMRRIAVEKGVKNTQEERYCRLSKLVVTLQEEITRIKVALVQWDNMALYYGSVAARLESPFVDMEDIRAELEEKEAAMRTLAAA